MSNVIQFPLKQEETYIPETDNSYSLAVDKDSIYAQYAYLGNELVKKPTNTREYLDLCKSKLTEEDYRDILCGILDLEYYTNLETPYKNIVDAYYTFLEI